MHPDVHAVVKRDHVARPHPNATEAERLPDMAFFGYAMNLNATVVRSRILPFHSAQPDHPRNDGITIRRIDADNFTRRRAIFYHRASRQMVTKFSGHKERAE